MGDGLEVAGALPRDVGPESGPDAEVEGYEDLVAAVGATSDMSLLATKLSAAIDDDARESALEPVGTTRGFVQPAKRINVATTTLPTDARPMKPATGRRCERAMDLRDNTNSVGGLGECRSARLISVKQVLIECKLCGPRC